MRIFYYRVTTNFGDHMNGWMWDELFPGWRDFAPERTLVGIGSLIKSDLGKVPGRKLVFGSGSGYGALPRPAQIADWDIRFVRGPMTARLLELPPEKAIVDAAWLIEGIEAQRATGPGDGRPVFIPHWTTDVYANWRLPCRMAGIDYVTPLQDAKSVFATIRGSRLAIVESLHGAIMADYFRVPWIPVATEGRVLNFKWLDFCMSVGLPFRPIHLPRTDRVERMISGGAAPSSYDIHYLPEPTEAQFDSPGYQDMAPVSAAYRARIRLRAIGRAARNRAIDAVNMARRTSLYERGYRAQAEKLAGLLQQVEAAPSFLSDDGVRAEKLERLAQQADRLRAEIAAG
jgi:succinoglycan biosynthesis protein ExoV